MNLSVPPMSSLICVVTGATSGIGLVTAREIARMGARVVIFGRNERKCTIAVRKIKEATNQEVEFILADLTSLMEVRHAAEQMLDRYPRIDILVNNAGAMFLRRQVSQDGIEMTFATNHFGHFLLTQLLKDRMAENPPSRIINVSSNSHRGVTLNFDDIQNEKRYSPMNVYGQSKLANVLFTYELARRLDGSGVTVNALHPGFVATNMGGNNGWFVRLFLPLVHLFSLSPEEGAQTSIYLASSPEVEGVTGKFFYKSTAVESSPESHNLSSAKRLWELSVNLTAEFGGDGFL